MPPIFATAADWKNSNFTLLNDFLKTNTESHIQTNFILFLVILSFISLFQKIVKKNFFTMNKKIIFE